MKTGPNSHFQIARGLGTGCAAKVLAALALWAVASAVAFEAKDGQYNLADYGPVANAADAEKAWRVASADIIAHGGGILLIPPGVALDWNVINDAPSATTRTPTITIIDRRLGYEERLVPATGRPADGVWAGTRVKRLVRDPIDMPMGVHSTLSIDTQIAGGTASYMQPALFAIKQGTDQRVYLPTIRGISIGMRLNITGSPRGYGQPFDVVTVKALGWDKVSSLNYFVADLRHDHPAESLVFSKHVVNSLTVTDHGNADNQSMGVIAKRKNYGLGDSFAISAQLVNMGNIMSGGGDEGGLAYAADMQSDLRPFRSTVERIDWGRQELVYAPGATRNFTLGSSRPIINMNPGKQVTAGTVQIVAPGHRDPWDPESKEISGKTAGGKILPGGAIIGSADCGWTEAVVGRFFALDEPSEYLDPKLDPAAGYTAAPDMRTHRWYQIQKVEVRPDGTKRIYVERTRWWSGNGVVPNLYDAENYTWDGHVRPLKYIIAPGAYVTDVSRAWTDSEATGGRVPAASPRTLRLAPSGDAGGTFDFATGDPIVQAIGQDPWNPTGVRVRHHNYVPSTIEDMSYDAVNMGRVMVHSGLHVGGGAGDLKEAGLQKDKQPRFRYGVNIGATTINGLRFGGDVRESAIRFEQPNGRAQPMLWAVRGGTASSTLTVDPETGDFALRGGGARMRNLVLEGGGISGTAIHARNLRGLGLPVNSGATEAAITFARPEENSEYAVHVQPTWLTVTAVGNKTADGFRIQFATPAPAGAKVDWILVR